MPMDKDTRGGGTEADGRRTQRYCSHCYRDGRFTDGFTSAREMVAFVRSRLKEQGFGPLKRWFYTSHIPKLARWRR
jgi:hypothetical protein